MPGSETSRARSWPWRAVIVILILMGGTVGVIAGFFWLGEKFQFRGEIRAALTRIGEGRADEVWRDSSYLLQRTINEDAFVDMGARMNRTLGSFVRITDVVEVIRTDSLAGEVSEVIAELEFQNGETVGTFGFHRSSEPDAPWRLVGIRVDIPEPLQAAAADLEKEDERIRAPDEVLFKLDEILASIRDGKARQVWKEAAEPFRASVSAEKFVALNRDLEASLGKFVRVLTVISSGLHPAKDRAKLNVLIEYEKQRTSGLFAFVKVGDDWQLSFFKPLVPEPVIPGRAPVAGADEPGIPRRPQGDLGSIRDAAAESDDVMDVGP
jgi:hypothetical protein